MCSSYADDSISVCRIRFFWPCCWTRTECIRRLWPFVANACVCLCLADTLYDIDLDTTITLDARLAYRDEKDPNGKWIEIVHSVEERPLNCKANEVRSVQIGYSDDMYSVKRFNPILLYPQGVESLFQSFL